MSTLKKTITLSLVLLIISVILPAKEKNGPPIKFTGTDIGNPALTGKTNVLNDGISMIAGGVDIWGTRDEFHFAYLEQIGDFDIFTRLESLNATHLYAKAGIMAREELDENSRHIFFQVFPDNQPRNKNNGGYEFQYRKNKGAEMKAIYPAKSDGTPGFPVNYPNTWIRLKRSGDEFSGFYSTDGINWKIYSVFTMKLSKKVLLGLALTSHDADKTATATFKNITISKK